MIWNKSVKWAALKSASNVSFLPFWSVWKKFDPFLLFHLGRGFYLFGHVSVFIKNVKWKLFKEVFQNNNYIPDRKKHFHCNIYLRRQIIHLSFSGVITIFGCWDEMPFMLESLMFPWYKGYINTDRILGSNLTSGVVTSGCVSIRHLLVGKWRKTHSSIRH